MPVPFESFTPAQLTDKLANLKKYEFTFNALQTGQLNQLQFIDLQELNQHYYEIFGSFNNISCCNDVWLPHIIEWYNQHKVN